MGQFFGTDGVRGRVGEYPITADFFLKLGWALGSVLAQQNQKTSVVIGKDTRASGYLFESALEAGLLSAGVDVGLLGPMPTPAIAYLTKAYNANAGVVISASHNHFQDNGVKFFSAEGFKLATHEQTQIEQKLSTQMQSVRSEAIGKAKRHEQALAHYVEFCQSTIASGLDLSHLKIVIDCAHGATYHIAQSVFSALGAQLVIINNKPDGFNINLNCGATDTQHLQRTVLAQKADLGIAFDGDGDRLIMIDSDGVLLDGDELVFIIGKEKKSQNKLQNNCIVGTKMTNLGIRKAIKNLDIDFIEADVGDRFVLEKMQKHHAILGGESSGHIICLDKTTSGDGIIAALQVLTALANSDKNLRQLRSEISKYAQTLINVKTTKKIDLANHSKLKKAQLKVEKSLGNDGRVLIRASGTEPLIRIMVEGKTPSLVQKHAELLAACLVS